MKNSTGTWLLYWSAITATIGFGFICDIEGARNVATFAVFTLAALAPFGLHVDTVKSLASQPEPPEWRTQATIGLQIGVLGVLVWHGAMFTGAAWAFGMVCWAVGRAVVKAKRAEARRAA
jgi:hypothetical protein